MNGYVFVIDSCYGDGTSNGMHAYCYKGMIRSGLPAVFSYVSEIGLGKLEDDDVFGELSPRMTRSFGQIDVQLSVKEVRKYLLDCLSDVSSFLQKLQKDIQVGADDPLAFSLAASSLCDPFDLRIQDGDVQYDATSWLYKKLVEANRNAEDSITFEIVQAFDYHY